MSSGLVRCITMILLCLPILLLGNVGAEVSPETGNSEISEIWKEIQHLRTLLSQERDLRLLFEQSLLHHLNTFSDFASRVNIYDDVQVKNNTDLMKKLEERLNILDKALKKRMETGCVSGTFLAWTHPIAPQWPVTKDIKFDPPFEQTPVITYGMTLLDSQYDTNVRAIIEAQNITRNGFELVLRKHANTKQWGLEASWMACPAR